MAVVARPPVFGGLVKAMNADKVKAVPGVTHVVELASGVAVVGTNFWSAKKGRDALEVDWDLGPGAKLEHARALRRIRRAAKTPGPLAHKAENPEAMKGAAKTVVAEYQVPYLAHAPMEPLNCTVEVQGDGAEIWVGTQFQGVDQAAAAKELRPQAREGEAEHDARGRRVRPARESRFRLRDRGLRGRAKVKVPVKVVWTREDDIRGGYYRPMYVTGSRWGWYAQNKVVGLEPRRRGPVDRRRHALRGDDGEGRRRLDFVEGVAWDRVTFRPIKLAGSRTSAFLSGEVDLIDGVPTADVAGLRRDPQVNLFQTPTSRIMFVVFDMFAEPTPTVADTGGGIPSRICVFGRRCRWRSIVRRSSAR